jgi:hypothetical protein
VLFDGPPAFDIAAADLPPRARVVLNPTRLGLVSSWNRCLSLAAGDAVHIMHADDQVGGSFYRSVRHAVGINPDCSFSVAGAPPRQTIRLNSEQAARVLVSRERPAVGSVVYLRSPSRDPICFSDAYPYCPDEELLPRLALDGGTVLIGSDLYHETKWVGQARWSTWRQADFVDVYWRARMDGTRRYSPTLRRFARDETRWAVTAVCAQLIRDDESGLARRHLRALLRLDPSAIASPRVAVTSTLTALPRAPRLLAIADWIRGR